MIHARNLRSALIGAALLSALACPVEAHGWVLVPPTPPSSVAVGGGESTFDGPVGGGEISTPEAPESVPEGTTPGLEPAPAPSVAATPAVTVTPAAGLPSGNSSGYGFARSGRARPKSQAAPWANRIRIEWSPVFPAASENYGAAVSDPSAGLRMSPSEGGWVRASLPHVLVIWDPSQKNQKKAMANLDADARVRDASHLFNCFRMDARSLSSKKQGEMSLEVFDRDGKSLGKVSGTKRLQKVYDLLDKAMSKDGRKLSKVTPRLSSLLNGMAYCDHQVEWMSAKVICPDCGHERQDVLETMEQLKVRKSHLERALVKVQGL